MSRTRAQTNRAIRQEALREQLAAKGLVQKVLDSVGKLEEAGELQDSLEVKKIQIAIDTRLALIKKYLPDLKSTELTGEGGGPVGVDFVTRTIVDPKSDGDPD